MTSGLEGAWTSSPAKWTTMYLDNLFKYEWKQLKNPAGATQWIPTDESAANLVPDAHIKGKFHTPLMLTKDPALKFDPSYRKIAQRFQKNSAEFENAFAKAWFKLTHNDMGPSARYIGADVPNLDLVWQDPIPDVNHKLIDSQDAAKLKAKIHASGLTVPELVRTASASSFRGTDMRGGENGARIRLESQKNWAANNP